MNCCNEPFTGQENQLAESVAHLYESEGAIAKGCCRGCWEFVNCFLFILYPVINIPARTSSAFLLGSLGWTLFSLTSSRRLSSFVRLPWSVYFLHSHSLSIFLWAVVLNYLIVAATLFRCLFHPPFFFLFFFVWLSFFQPLYVSHPAILFFWNRKSQLGEHCLDSRREQCSSRWVGRGGAPISDVYSGGYRFDHQFLPPPHRTD